MVEKNNLVFVFVLLVFVSPFWAEVVIIHKQAKQWPSLLAELKADMEQKRSFSA